MIDTDGFIEECLSNWHHIMPWESNYIDMHKYCEIQDVIAKVTACALRVENDDINNNHSLCTHILQEPECTGVSRFFRWLKKKVLGSERLEMLRIVLDDTYYADMPMDIIIGLSNSELTHLITPTIQRLISKSKEN